MRIVIAITCLGLLAACTGDGSDDREAIHVVTAFYPLWEAASHATSTIRVRTYNLTPAGSEPHDSELGPREISYLQEADIVFYIGGIQPAVEDALAGSDARIEDMLALAPDDDPHIWLDPLLMRAMADRIRRVIWEHVEPPDKEPALRFSQSLELLHRDFARGLRNCRSRVLVTSHDAFGHLAARYGLDVHPIAGISPEDEPTADRLAQLQRLVRREGVTTIFTETLVSPAIAETIARETGARTAVLDPIEGLTEEQIDAGETYASVMRDNLEALREGLGCR